MSALTTPKGPLPARVYWFRRLLLLSVVLLLVFVTGRLLGGSSDGKSDAEADVRATTAGAEVDPAGQTPSAGDPAASATPEAEQGKKRKKATPSVEPTPEPPPLPTPSGVCEGEDVVVTPVVGAGRTDGQVDMALVLRTRTTPACTWQVSAETVTIKISSGNDDYWFSSQCPNAVPAQDVVLYAETDTTVPFVWSGRRSDAECSNLTAWAMPGYYHVMAAAFEGEPTEVQFERAPASITETRTAEPKQEKAAGKNKKKSKKQKKQRNQEPAPGTPEPSGAVEPTPTP